ncbi:hypothetical protein ATCC90586_001937 [Pythium insidiosum]|nr:hypothetical protein ATCC90586_001937 [Pythium insidiosum]
MGQRVGGRRDKSLYSVEDDVLLLREIMRSKPFSAGHGKIMKAWDAAAAQINACEAFERKIPTDRGPGKVVSFRFYYLLDMRRQERSLDVTNRDVSAAHKEREDLLDGLLELTQRQAAVHSSAEPSTVKDHVYILREVVDRPPMLLARNKVTSTWEAIARKMRSIPDFSKPQVTGEIVRRLVRQLIAPNEANRSPKKQKLDDRAVEMMKLRLNAEARVREHELRVREQRRVQEQRRMELEDRQAGLEQARQELAAEHNAQVQVAKAVAEGISTGIAAILKP